MTTVEALKDLSIAAGCGAATGDTTAQVLTHIAEHYTPPTPPTTNLFDINGEIDVNYAGEKKNKNTVENGVLTSEANSTYDHSVGQLIDTVVGKTYSFKAKVLTFGTGSYGSLGCYDFGSDDGEWEEEPQSELELIYTARSNKTLFGFCTGGGTGAQFTDIEVKEVSE